MVQLEAPTSRFIGARTSADGARVVIFGAGYDGTASFRPGTRFGPAALRAASDGVETYCPELDRDLEDCAYADVGDAPLGFGAPAAQIEAVRATTSAIFADGAIPFMLGGEHSLTAGAVQAALERHPDLVLLQFDAHADLRPDYLGEPLSHACVMRRCVERGVELVQLGIRSGTREEWQWIRDHGTLTTPGGLAAVLEASGTRPIYLTLDIDVFDPSLVCGTGTPEPGGWDWTTFARLVQLLRVHAGRLVGCDVMELSPQLDPSGVSAVVAAKCVRQLLLLVS